VSIILRFCVVLNLIGGYASAQAPVDGDTAAEFAALSENYLNWYFASYPIEATALGIHAYDTRIDDMSREAIRSRTRDLHQWLERLQAIALADLTGEAVYDYPILEHAIRAQLLELEEVRRWQYNPILYNRLISSSIATLVEREFAPLAQRLPALIARLDQIPHIIAAAQRNLAHVPRPWAEQALRNARGTASFLSQDVPAALAEQGLKGVDTELTGRWVRAQQGALRHIDAFVKWLEQELLPNAHGDYRLGRDLFERKLRYEEHITLNADQLRALNEAAIAEYQAWVTREAARIDPSLSATEVMAQVASQYPSPHALLSTAEHYVEEARRFVLDHDIVTLPESVRPIVRPSPAYSRGGFASMSAPGPFETNATESYYSITTLDPNWTPEQQRQHLTYFNYSALLSISVHETIPGHFVQYLYRSQYPTRIRQMFATGMLVEGWAHYCEQMMVDAGLGENDPKVRLGLLRRALQRHARWYAALALHVDGVSIEDAARRFAQIAYFADFPALRETERGTYNPTYLNYALGRMEILKLREDYRRHVESRGETFSLRDFHDRFLRLGLPLPLARAALIQNQET
jgi:uncharacterized protein (DUF885 family)